MVENAAVSNNGKPTNDELREMEVLITDGPLPVIPPGEQDRLIAADPELGRKLCTCYGNGCSDEAPCNNCQVNRRYLALLLHREKYGRVKHPSEIAGDAYEGPPAPSDNGNRHKGAKHGPEAAPKSDSTHKQPCRLLEPYQPFPVDALPESIQQYVEQAP